MEKIGNNGTTNADVSAKFSNEELIIVVFGGPASGKGTLCSKIVEQFGFCHLSAGDLLDVEINSGSSNGEMIKHMKSKGELVPAEIVIRLLQKAMQDSENKKFLIDGFPRNKDNLLAAHKLMKFEPDFVIFLDCSEETMIKRVLGRNQGRIDDNKETAEKRIRVYTESTLPIISYYDSQGKVEKIDAEKSKEEVFEAVENVFLRKLSISGEP